MTRRPRIYIAGPISRGDLLHNIQQADDAMLALMNAGLAPFNPILSVFAGSARRVAPPGAALEVVAVADRLAGGGFRAVTHEGWLEMDFAWVDAADALLRLPGESIGADAEVARAESRGIPVFATVEGVLANFAGKNVPTV